MFSVATKLNVNETDFFISDIELTYTPFIDKNSLQKDIDCFLDKLETASELNHKDFRSVSSLINLYQGDKKEEYQYRLESLVKLSKISDEIDKFEQTDEPINVDDINKLIATLSTCGHGPLRSLLEHKLNILKSKFYVQMDKEKDILRVLLTTDKLVELDEVICELSVEEYINLGRERRLIVSKELLKLDREKLSLEEITEIILNFTKELNFPNHESIDNFKYKETIDEGELLLIKG